MTSLLLWVGPVQASDIANVVWSSPVDLLVLSHGPSGGFGSSSFSDLARSVTDASGHLLPTLLAHAHIDPAAYGTIAVAGFSAAHGLLAPLLLADGDAFAGAVALDACFSDPARLVKPGYAAYGTRAVRGEKLFVMSASAGGGRGSGATIGPGVPDYSTGYDCARGAFDAAVAAAGFDPNQISTTPPPAIPPFTDPNGGFERAGNFSLLDYHGAYQHGQHVHVLAKPVLETYLNPLFAGAPPGAIAGGQAGAIARASYAPEIFAAVGVGLLALTLYRARRR